MAAAGPTGALLGEGAQDGGGDEVAGAVVEGLGGQYAGAAVGAGLVGSDADAGLDEAVEAAPAAQGPVQPQAQSCATIRPGWRADSASGARPCSSRAPGR